MSDVKEWLVYSRGHNMFWRPEQSGYTYKIHEAGRFTQETAQRLCKMRDVTQKDGSPSEIMMPAPEVVAKKDRLLIGKSSSQTLTERDRLWCLALIERVDIGLVQSVLARFLELRS